MQAFFDWQECFRTEGIGCPAPQSLWHNNWQAWRGIWRGARFEAELKQGLNLLHFSAMLLIKPNPVSLKGTKISCGYFEIRQSIIQRAHHCNFQASNITNTLKTDFESNKTDHVTRVSWKNASAINRRYHLQRYDDNIFLHNRDTRKTIGMKRCYVEIN